MKEKPPKDKEYKVEKQSSSWKRGFQRQVQGQWTSKNQESSEEEYVMKK